jgi:HPt (histidine-containing phosphotransfer) domain-containing protein
MMASMNDSNVEPERLALIDREQLREMLELACEDENSDTFARWIARIDADLARFRALLADKDKIASLDEIANTTHALRGSCLMMGAAALACMFAELEAHAKAGRRADVDALYAASRELESASLHALREASRTPLSDSQ